MKHSILLTCIISLISPAAFAQEENADAIAQAAHSAEIAGHSLSKVHRWLHDIALPKIDKKTGLYIADGEWNYRNTAADCYPFLTWAAWATDKEALNGPVRSILHAERALCNVKGRIPAPYNYKEQKSINIKDEDLVFEASEYVKDCLIAIVEITGRDEWFDRMRAIEDDLWEYADIETPFGLIPSTNIEVNGEQLQALARLYTMTGDEKYLTGAMRLADYYFADENFVPTRLRDHGCEIIGGLGLLQAVLTTHRPEKAAEYGDRLKKMYDTILERGTLDVGMMYNHLTKRDGWNGGMSDGWGYNYVGYLCYDMAMGTSIYTAHMIATLTSMMDPKYKDYPWEGESIDGYADSIEGAIYMLNRLPVAKGFEWVNRETRNNIVDHPKRLENGELWGTMKLQANGVRTTVMQALMHTQGVLARPWQQALELGAAPVANGVVIAVRTKEGYEGLLEFDIPRHRLYMGFQKDWPRMNTVPEWFTVEPQESYAVTMDGVTNTYTGAQLHNGLAVELEANQTLILTIATR